MGDALFAGASPLPFFFFCRNQNKYAYIDFEVSILLRRPSVDGEGLAAGSDHTPQSVAASLWQRRHIPSFSACTRLRRSGEGRDGLSGLGQRGL